MARKNVTVSLRKPPPAESLTLVSSEEPGDVEAAARASWSAPRVPQLFWGEQVPGSGGMVLQECLLHLEPDLARKLALRCIEDDRNPSAFVAEVVERALESEKPAPTLAIRAARAVVRMIRAQSPFVAAVLDR